MRALLRCWGFRTVIAAINKMDLVDFSPEVFKQHSDSLQALARQLGDSAAHPGPGERSGWRQRGASQYADAVL